jgi:hypothetical protein
VSMVIRPPMALKITATDRGAKRECFVRFEIYFRSDVIICNQVCERQMRAMETRSNSASSGADQRTGKNESKSFTVIKWTTCTEDIQSFTSFQHSINFSCTC